MKCTYCGKQEIPRQLREWENELHCEDCLQYILEQHFNCDVHIIYPKK